MSALPSKYYLKAKDPKFAALTAGVVFLDMRSPWRWLAIESGRDLREHFTVEVVKEVYFGSNLESDFT
ncbi:hypothetical protein D305_gp53 [Pseudomonas phage UFV-P2]|uniref:Uncharacterized protein n=1 Tax=Pseudomonas phage UFV-P2 TaxID=1235661 RepID=M4T683_9CAUD|nr:hypothetical protein D305_gp53 [Pseudomonas phage UFV-P2]AGH62730.1 hypothetical protein [Pseudomonas phage UFV-P2]